MSISLSLYFSFTHSLYHISSICSCFFSGRLFCFAVFYYCALVGSESHLCGSHTIKDHNGNDKKVQQSNVQSVKNWKSIHTNDIIMKFIVTCTFRSVCVWEIFYTCSSHSYETFLLSLFNFSGLILCKEAGWLAGWWI